MKLLISACLCLILGIAAPISGVSDRYLVEDNLTKIAQTALNAMFGANNFIVRVQVQMTDSKYSVKYTQESTPKKSNRKKTQEEVYILPGVPALKNIAPGSLNQLPYDSVTTMVEPRIKRMLVYVLANKSYPRSKARKAEAALREILSLKQGRDKVKMEYKPFYEDPLKETQNITIVPGKEALVTVQNAFYVLALLFLALFAAIYSQYQKKLLAKESGDGGPSINVNPNLELPESMGGAGSNNLKVDMNSQTKTYFDFVTLDNINDFIFLIKSQKLKAEYISLMLSFLPANLAAKVLNDLDAKTQASVVLGLSEQRLGSKAILDKLEKKLKAEVECFVGGDEKVASLVGFLSSKNRKSIAQTAKKSDPKNYKKVRPFMILFEDLTLLDQSELQLVLSELNLEQLAVSLLKAEQALFTTVMDNLTKGAKEMVNQYMELKAESTSEKDIESSQDAIIKTIKKMATMGKINLMDKLKNA